MKKTGDVCLFVFPSIVLNQANTAIVVMVEGGGTEMTAMQTENMVLELQYSY